MSHASHFIHPAYPDGVFKHLMSFSRIRNNLLSEILKKDIVESELLDHSLHPFDRDHRMRA